MKTRKFIAILIVALFTALCGCTATIDTGETNQNHYKNYDFWQQENKLRLVTSFSIEDMDNNLIDGISSIGEKELSAKDIKRVKKLQSGIIKYFKQKFNVDLTEKLSKQELRVFTSNEDTGVVMGYVCEDDPNILNLNELLWTDEYSFLFENTYVHETLHQLGIRSDPDSNGMLFEGVTDAFTDLILTYMGKWSYPTEYYIDGRTLAYQLICVDEELPHLYFEVENFSLTKRITERLKNIPQVHRKTKTPGKRLDTIVDILYSSNFAQWAATTHPYYYQYEAQEIVRAYCQTFTPSHKQIDYIRRHYLVDDYESLEFEKDDKGGYSVKEDKNLTKWQ